MCLCICICGEQDYISTTLEEELAKQLNPLGGFAVPSRDDENHLSSDFPDEVQICDKRHRAIHPSRAWYVGRALVSGLRDIVHSTLWLLHKSDPGDDI